MQPDYNVYIHTNKENQKRYIEIVRGSPSQRWCGGSGYKQNKKFYNDIIKYGWDSFSHEVIDQKFTYKDAREKEAALIQQYDSVKHGYNNSLALPGEHITYDFYDFIPMTTDYYEYTNAVDYFTRMPNKLIRCDLNKNYGIGRILLVLYILIDRHRSYEDISYITIKEILETCGYKITTHKPKIFYDSIKALLFLQESNYISADFDPYSLNYNENVPIKIISKNFDQTERFTMIHGKIFDKIIASTSKLNKENLLLAFLYVNSYIGNRPKNSDGTEKIHNPESAPEAFFRNLHTMSSDIAMSRDTVTNCMQELVSLGILKKKVVGSVKRDNTPPQNVPNIYVINKDNYKQEIEWALDKMKEIYQVDSFGKPCGKEL